MVHKEVLKKIKGGKMIKIEVELDKGRIANVVISGDFFAYPLGAIENIERSLKGKRAEKEEIKKTIDQFRGKCTIVGATFDDIVDLLAQTLS